MNFDGTTTTGQLDGSTIIGVNWAERKICNSFWEKHDSRGIGFEDKSGVVGVCRFERQRLFVFGSYVHVQTIIASSFSSSVIIRAQKCPCKVGVGVGVGVRV